MESKLLAPTVSDSSAEAAQPAQQTCAPVDALAEVRQAIAADCRVEPAEYLDEVRVAAGGE
jgi:hypothetical protein